jgi:oligosaccharide translocation protein RFT1
MSRVYFSKTLTESQGDSNAGNAKTAEAELHSASNNSLVSAWQVLSSILSTQLAASTLLCSFAPPFLPLSLQLFLPRRYLSTSAPHLLGAWIYYIPILAVNGVLEAFMLSVATPSDIHRQSR